MNDIHTEAVVHRFLAFIIPPIEYLEFLVDEALTLAIMKH